MAFMQRWAGKTGTLILVNECKKLNIKNLDDLTMSEKEKLMNAIVHDVLSTFLSHSKFLVARAQLVELLGIPLDSPIIQDHEFKKARSPSMIGKYRTSERRDDDDVLY